MVSAPLIIFVLSVSFILHTYLLYPLIMIGLFGRKKNDFLYYSEEDNLPDVAILIAAYNEEKVIEQKIDSIFNTSYAWSKIKVYVGSDASSDNTNNLVEGMKAKYPNLELVVFKQRAGKINIVNHLQSLGDEDILILTDANVFFTRTTIYELVKYFKDKNVGIVAANIDKKSKSYEGISRQEITYLSLENKIKAAESRAFKLIMGAEGGCYAIRNNLFSKVPSKFNVDDFYITFQVLLKGKEVLFNEMALCVEDVPGDTKGEYIRKVRISSGNFQNLFFFKSTLVKFWKPLGFTFLSHKVLRWLTPFFLLTAFMSSILLMQESLFFKVIFYVQLTGFLFPFFNSLFKFNNFLLKYISHFYLMNLALLHGFCRFVLGIKNSVWQPIDRNV